MTASPAAGAAPTGVPAPPAEPIPTLQAGHLGLNVTDVARARRFYQQVFGLELLAESAADAPAGRRYAFLGGAGAPTLTLWEQSAGRFDAARPGLHHLAFRVDSIDAVREVERRLQALGATLLYDGVVPHAEGEDSGGVFFEDPDGTRLEVFAPAGAGGAPAPSGAAPSCGFF